MAEPTELAEEQRRALDRLSQAVAIHCKHRRSLDLDFFSLRPDADLGIAERSLSEAFARCEVISRSDAAVQLLCDGVRIDLVRYPYAPLESPPLNECGLAIAGLRDLGVMKLAAISRRGLRRDFWDLFVILQTTELGLGKLAEDYVRRFGVRESDLYDVLKALTYFEDPVEPRLREWQLPGGTVPESAVHDAATPHRARNGDPSHGSRLSAAQVCG
jgi:hypothetical protein